MNVVVLLIVLIYAFSAFGAPVSFEAARDVARKHLERTRGGKIKSAHGGLQKTSADAPPYFVIEKENGGFVIISADDIAVPILGETDGGVFDRDSMPPAMRWLLGTYEEQITEAIKSGAARDDETKKLWKQAAQTSSAAITASYPQTLLSTMWSQDEPYWNNTPKMGTKQTLTGCVATAMAQIMNFHKHPTRTNDAIPAYISEGGLSVSALSSVSFDWANMRDKYGYYPATDGGGTHTDSEGNRYYKAEWNAVQGQAVANLMNAAGKAVKMNYGTEASGAYTSDAVTALTRYFDYDNCIRHVYSANSGSISAGDWKELVIGQIENRSPVFYSGKNTLADGGHGFIIDGYNDFSDIFHLNWGWNGRYNGFFPLTALNPRSGEQYNALQEMIINIMPNQGGSPPSQIKVTKFDVAVSAAESAVNADVRAKMNYGADFDGKIGLAVVSGAAVSVVLDSAEYSISNTYDPKYGKYTVNYKNAALKWNFGANTALWAELSGNRTVQPVTKRGAGAWTPVGETKQVAVPYIYIVTFDAAGGSVTPLFGATGANGKLAELPTPARNGYFFEGWFTEKTGGTEVTADRVYREAATIYAQWTPVYIVTFDAGGGTVTPKYDTTGSGGKLASLPTPARDGYFFGGWFTEKAGGAEAAAGTVFVKNTTLYAKWKVAPVILVNGSADSAIIPRVGDTLSVIAGGGAAYSYAWKLGGAAIGTANKPYVVTAEDIGGAITLEITESGETYAAKRAAVIKGAGPEPPSSPLIEYVTYSGVKLAETPGNEYSRDRVKWQESAVFNGLTHNTRYTFYQRAAETKAAYASPASSGTDTLTEALTVKSLYKAVLLKLRVRAEVPEVQPSAASGLPMDEFTAGPNPIRRGGSPPPVINFYRYGKRLASCELRVYDANGNFVNKINISDKAVGVQARRVVGSWNLKDEKGRPVYGGTYLVRGAVKTSDGKKERVSLIIGVR